MEFERYELYVLMFPNGKQYAGISYDMLNRFEGHKRSAFKGVEFPVYAAMRKYGYENVTPVLMVVGAKTYIKQLEIAYIAKFQLRDRQYGYNLTLGGDISMMHAPEVAAKVSATKRRQFVENPAMYTAFWAGRDRPEVLARRLVTIRTPEVSAKKSTKLRGRKFTDDVRANMKVAQNRPGVKEARSIKVKETWSDPALRERQSQRFRGRAISQEQRDKISLTLMGHPGASKGEKRLPEVGAKISAAKMGHAVSEETRQKIRDSLAKSRAAAIVSPCCRARR